MQFSRTTDPELIRSTLTHPKIWPHVSDDYAPPVEDYAPPIADCLIYLLVSDGDETLGLFVFHPHNAVLWEVHTCLLPNAWGPRAVEAAAGAARWMFENTPAERLMTNVPAYNRLALRFARRTMTEFGRNPRSYRKDGVLHDQILLGLSKE